LFGLHQRLGS
jgi:hypothetical protein